ncbi:MAG: hypothetical protein Q8Q36_02215 [bacterium]|nr:hypothetical protein [bacterium]
MASVLKYKRAIVALVVGLFLIAAAYFVSTNATETHVYRNLSDEETVALKTLIGKDADGDGVKDWEEALWGTDPLKRDTDGDGTPDGTEIATMREVAGIKEPVPTGAKGKEMNETEAFARELFAASLALKQAGKLTDASLENLSASLINSFATSTLEAAYGVSDLATVPDSEAARDAYRRALAVVFKKYTSSGLGNELALISEALSSDDNAALLKLSAYSSQYERFGNDLLKITVPDTVAAAHTEVINGFLGMSRTLLLMKALFDNPLPGFVAFTGYARYENAAAAALKAIELYLK